MVILEAENISRSFGKASVLRDVSLRVEGGSVYGLVGLNGAGKTTFLRVLLGLLRGGGRVSALGHDPWRHSPEFYRMVGVVTDSDGFNGDLTVRENLRFFAGAKGLSPIDADGYFEKYWGGTDIYTSVRKVKFLSRGQRAQCGLCRAFLGWPQLYFFDEPVVGLDFLAYEHFKDMVVEARSRGAAVLISSHQLEVIDDLCDRVGLLRGGSLSEVRPAEGGKFSGAVKAMYREVGL